MIELPIGAIGWALAAVSLIAMSLLLRDLSQRLGQALHMKKYYLLYDASIVLQAVALAAILIKYLNLGLVDEFLWPVSRAFVLVGTLLALGATIKYWAWIFPEVLAPVKK